MRKTYAIAALVLLLPAAAAAWHYRPRAAVPIDERRFRHETALGCTPGGEVAAVIRNDGDGWYAIDDEAHTPVNVHAIETDSRVITVIYSFTATKIHTFSVVPDETLALAGINGGASVDLGTAQIAIAQIGRDGVERANPIEVSTIRYWQSNLWISGKFAADCEP